MSEPDFEAYAHQLMEEVRTNAEIVGCDLSEAFAELVLEQFCADGHTEDATALRLREHGAEVSGWGVSSDDRCLDLFITRYSPRADEDYKLDSAQAVTLFKRVENFLTRTLAGQRASRKEAPEVACMQDTVMERFRSVEKLRFILITNARSVMRDRPPALSIGGRAVVREVWDLRRLANWAASGSKAEPIVAEFAMGLECLATPRTDDDYSVFLAIVPGRDLAELYSAYGSRLLELNVRSFLQLRGNVNRGILETLKNCPERFLAYNNGIAATASKVEFDDARQRVVRRIHNLQIVNGGQTTATIHYALRNKIPIGKVLVQMKLTVVSPEKLEHIVPQISAYSNTQNRVTASDLKANSAFHVDVERILRTLWAPATPTHPHDTHWFYERARGQYANALAREGTPARQKVFRTANPPTHKFTKSDLAKFQHSWAMLPHWVSRGAEKNFVLFSERLEIDPVTVDKDYCRHLVAKAIVFRRTDKLVAKRKFGGFKANIVAYTVAKLVHATRARLDLDRIWREQDLSPALREAITELCQLVQKVITSPPQNRRNIGEWTKRPECWDAVRSVDWTVPPALEQELLEVDTYSEDLRLIRSTTSADWEDLAAWGRSTGLLEPGQRSAAAEVGRALSRGWDPAGRHVRDAVGAMRLAREHGFQTAKGFERLG